MKCDICGKEVIGRGHNPAPLKGKVCCDVCNNNYVIPARIKAIKTSEALNDKDSIIEGQDSERTFQLRGLIGFLLKDEVDAIDGYDLVLRQAELTEEDKEILEEIRNDELDHIDKLNEIYKKLAVGSIEADNPLAEENAIGREETQEEIVEDEDILSEEAGEEEEMNENIIEEIEEVRDTLQYPEMTPFINKARSYGVIFKEQRDGKWLFTYNKEKTTLGQLEELGQMAQKINKTSHMYPGDNYLYVDDCEKVKDEECSKEKIKDSDTVNDIGSFTVGSKYRWEDRYNNASLTLMEYKDEKVKLSLDNGTTSVFIPVEKFEDMVRKGTIKQEGNILIEVYGKVKTGDSSLRDKEYEDIQIIKLSEPGYLTKRAELLSKGYIVMGSGNSVLKMGKVKDAKNKEIILKSPSELQKIINHPEKYEHGTVVIYNGMLLGMIYNKTFVRGM